jgi:colanic acid biosynthesis glycosyl transferase WcaI
MSVHILVVSMNYKPELTGIGKYSSEMSEWLVDKGCDVVVVTTPPYYPNWKIGDGYNSFSYKREVINGVSVIRCPVWIPSSVTSIKRILHLMVFALTSFPIIIWTAIRIKPDLIFVVEPPLFSCLGSIIGGKIAGSTVWLHVQDFEIDAAFNLGILKSEMIKKMVLSIESFIFNKMHILSTISEQMMSKLEAKTKSKKHLVMFKNWVDLIKIYPAKTVLYRRKYKIGHDTLVFLYSGNMGEKQGLELVIDSAMRLREKRQDILFLMCGDGVVKNELVAKSKGNVSIKFIPLQPVEQLNDLLNTADVHLLPQKADADGLVMPSKLINMLASGKPIIATVKEESEIAKILKGAGIVTEPGNVDQFVDAIELIADSKEKREQYGKQARKDAVEYYDRDKILDSVFNGYIK